ncbi:hypothetical protein G4B88_021458 [Cannabis sativa]|uniref:Uncharacterized protein n=1 Tax=Cannabis sativa TaxID=3483 RepID=A0A7J6DN06_CANSA|nr:hypothetical protein G4B88_021458 [Cannabis sativa]
MNMRHKKIKRLMKVSVFKRQMARILTLDFQLHCLDYEAENWYHADLDFETFKLLQMEKGESFFSFARDMTLKSTKAMIDISKRGLWLLLEQKGFHSIIKRMLTLPHFLINELPDEPVTCFTLLTTPNNLLASLDLNITSLNDSQLIQCLMSAMAYELLYVEIHIIEILNIMNLSVATGTRARLFGTHISGGVLRAASAHGLPPLALVVCILMKQHLLPTSRTEVKLEVIFYVEWRIYLQLITYHSNIIGNDHSANLKVIVVQY